MENFQTVVTYISGTSMSTARNELMTQYPRKLLSYRKLTLLLIYVSTVVEKTLGFVYMVTKEMPTVAGQVTHHVKLDKHALPGHILADTMQFRHFYKKFGSMSRFFFLQNFCF